MQTDVMRHAMAAKGYTFRDLGFATKRSPGYLCRLANGTRQPSADVVISVAKALGVRPEDLAGSNPKQAA